MPDQLVRDIARFAVLAALAVAGAFVTLYVVAVVAAPILTVIPVTVGFWTAYGVAVRAAFRQGDAEWSEIVKADELARSRSG